MIREDIKHTTFEFRGTEAHDVYRNLERAGYDESQDWATEKVGHDLATVTAITMSIGPHQEMTVEVEVSWPETYEVRRRV